MRWQENFILWLLRIIIEFIQPQDFAIVHFHWFSYKGFIWIYLTTQWKKVIDLILILINSKSMPWSKQSQVSPEFCMPNMYDQIPHLSYVLLFTLWRYLMSIFQPYFIPCGTEHMIYFVLMTSTHLLVHDISGIFSAAYPAHK